MSDPKGALRSLLSRSREFSNQPIETSGLALSRCSGGYSHDNYHVTGSLGEFALRVRRSPPPTPWHELSFLSTWAEPLAPTLVAWDEATGNLLTQWCDWPSQHRNAPTVEHCRALLNSIVRLPVPVDDLPTYPLRSQIQRWLKSANDARALALLSNTPDLPGPYSLCHNDLNGDNLQHSDGRWLVLDWEWGGLNDPLFDAATLAADLPDGCANLEQLTPDANPEQRRLAWRWFCLREYAYAVNALLSPGIDPAAVNALIAQRDRYANDPALSVEKSN